MKNKKQFNKSVCCNAEIDVGGGGYDGEDICPIELFCKKCGQTLEINNLKVQVHDPKTGKIIQKED